VQAVALLGAKVLLCGLRAEVALALSTASVDLRSLLVARSLQEALLALVSSKPEAPIANPALAQSLRAPNDRLPL
jgi:hypothetical protein